MEQKGADGEEKKTKNMRKKCKSSVLFCRTAGCRRPRRGLESKKAAFIRQLPKKGTLMRHGAPSAEMKVAELMNSPMTAFLKRSRATSPRSCTCCSCWALQMQAALFRKL